MGKHVFSKHRRIVGDEDAYYCKTNAHIESEIASGSDILQVPESVGCVVSNVFVL
jgi:hypothetical protein